MANFFEKVRGAISARKEKGHGWGPSPVTLQQEFTDLAAAEELQKAFQKDLEIKKTEETNNGWEGLSPEEQAKRMSEEWHHF